MNPYQEIVFLGFVVNSRQLQSIIVDCRRVQRQETVSVRRVIGRMMAGSDTSPLMLQESTAALAFKSTQSFESTIQLNSCAKKELQWWMAEVRQWNGRPIISPVPDMTIETDAYLLGLGATLGRVSMGGLWTEQERRHHINWLELQGGAFTVKTFARGKTNIHI